VSVAFIALIVAIEAWPIYQIATASLRRGPITAPSLWIIAPSLAIVAALTAAVVAVSLRAGIRRLEQ
jgi:hypothetical protein